MEEEETKQNVEEEEEEDWRQTWNDGGEQSDTANSFSKSIKDRFEKPNSKSTDSTDSVPGSVHEHVQTGEMTVPAAGADDVLSRMLLNDHKAGMEGLDKEKINKIIMDASKGSRFYENERKKEDQVNKRIEEQQRKMKEITSSQLKEGESQADSILEDFDSMRDLSRTIVHIDMDMFYAAVEMRDNPSLQDKPMAVGGLSMLSTSNYHARKFGVRAAMPGFIGKKLCPELVIVPLNFDKYTAVSKQVRDILSDYDSNFCPMSLDEAYLDITDHVTKRFHLSDEERTYLLRKVDKQQSVCFCDLNETIREEEVQSLDNDHVENSPTSVYKCDREDSIGLTERNVVNSSVRICVICGKPLPEFERKTFGLSVEDAVYEMRSRIEQRTTLTASAGIAPNMMLAKICSDRNKPNGQYRIQNTKEAVMEFIKDLPIRKISGIGKVTEKMLNALGIQTTTDLYHQRALLYYLYSQISFHYFMRICLGIGSTTVERESGRKSMSTERTFREISVPTELYAKCRELSEALAEDLKEEELKGKTVGIKVKTVKFEVKTRMQTLTEYTWDVETIFTAARDLLRIEIQNMAPQPLRLRLMGVRMSGLLHQTLCKKQQNTLTSLLKKMEYTQQGMSTPKTQPVSFVNREERSECSSAYSDEQMYTYGNEGIPLTQYKSFPEVSDLDKCSESNSSDNVVTQLKECHTDTCRLQGEKGSYTKFCDNSGQGKTTLEAPVMGPVHDTVQNEDRYTDGLMKNDSTERTKIEAEDRCGMSTEGVSSYTCPVCCGTLECDSLSEFNSHIDVCLNKSLVMECSRYVPPTYQVNTKSTTRKAAIKTEKSGGSKQNENSVMETKQESALRKTPKKGYHSPEKDKIEKMVCPVCFMVQSQGDLHSFNQHVDACLNKEAVSQILTEQKSWEKSTAKRSISSPSPQSSKRRRQSSGTLKCGTLKCGNIVSFFKNAG